MKIILQLDGVLWNSLLYVINLSFTSTYLITFTEEHLEWVCVSLGVKFSLYIGNFQGAAHHCVVDYFGYNVGPPVLQIFWAPGLKVKEIASYRLRHVSAIFVQGM